MTNKKRYYPCASCKGRGDYNDGDFVDVGIGGGGVQVSAHTECGWCEGEGMIEIGGRIHLNNKAFRYMEKHPELLEDREYSWDELIKIGLKSMKSV